MGTTEKLTLEEREELREMMKAEVEACIEVLSDKTEHYERAFKEKNVTRQSLCNKILKLLEDAKL